MSARQRWLDVAAVAAVALLASLATLPNEFVQDDGVLIAENARLHDLANWRVIVSTPFWPPPASEDLYRPLTALALSVQYALGGGGPLLFRLVSLLLYAAASVGVLVLARRFLSRGPALGAALLFAAHPVHVEAVALGVAQNELLVGLLGVVMTLRYLARRRDGDGSLRAADWGVLGSLYLIASLLKEQGLVLPGLLIAGELALLAGPWTGRVRMLAPGFGMLAALGAGVLVVRTRVLGEIAGTFTAEALEGLGVGGRVLTMLAVVPEWVRLLLWPAHLQADWSPQEITASTGVGPLEALGLLALLTLAVLAWRARRTAPVVTFGLLWAGVALLPVSNVLLPTGIVLAERTLFLPSIGAMLALGGAGAWVYQRWEARRGLGLGFAIAVTALVAAGIARSSLRHTVWRNEQTYSLRGVQDAPRSYRMQMAAGYALFQAGARDSALAAYQRAIVLAPRGHVWKVRNDLTRRLWETGENALAVDQALLSVEETPAQDEAWYYLVVGYLTLGEYAAAGIAAEEAMSRGITPERFHSLRALADTAAREGAPPGSIRVEIQRPRSE